MTGNPIRNEEVIFHAARAIASPDERAAYLAQACGEDGALRARVEALVKVYQTEPSNDGVVPGAGSALFEQLAQSAQPPVEEPAGTVIGRYKLLERIGEGGFGIVYLAEQQVPVRRKVALKLIKAGLDTKQVIARFEGERQALALMDHENIAKVLDAGATDSGRPYFVMELVHGVPITEYCDEKRLPPRERLELFVKVCQPVKHAHTKGVIHRDLKPTNVMVALHDGVPVPKVIDFGVAKATGQERLTDHTLFTQFAQMVGTPLYMSPEQADMSGLDVDTRSDVYSLGVLLYELLTGTTPFDKERLKQAAHDEVRRIIREEEPPRPSTRINILQGEKLATVSAHRRTEAKRLGQLVRRELDWIVMKALEKDRARRYETPNGLAKDVERYLNDEEVHACPPSAAYRFCKFARRNRAALATAVTIAAVLVLAAAASTHQTARARAAEREARRAAAELALDKGQLLGESGDANLALLWLSRSLEQAPSDALELQHAIRASLGGWRRHINSLRAVLPHDGGVYAVAFQPGGELLTACWRSGTERVTVEHWDVTGTRRLGQPLMFPIHPYRRSLTLSPDARFALLSAMEGTVQLIDLRTGHMMWKRRENGVRAVRAVFSPDRTQILIGYEIDSPGGSGLTGKAQLHDAGTGELVGPQLDHPRPVHAVAFHPDGKSFVTFGGAWSDARQEVEARFWDLHGRENRQPLRHKGMALAAAFSPDGKRLLSGHWDRTALLWNLLAPQEPVALRHESPVASVAFSPDGKTLLTGAFDGAVRVWDAAGRRLGPPLRQGHLVDVAVFSGDGRSMLVGTRGDAARLWDLAVGDGATRNDPQGAAAFPLAVSPDGRTILTRAAEHMVVLRDAVTMQPIGGPLPHHGPVVIGGTSILPGQRHACSSDRRRILTIEEDHCAKLWDAQTGQLVAELRPAPATDPLILYSAAFSPDSTLVVTGHSEFGADVWDATTGKLVRRLPHGGAGGVFSVAFSPDGRTVLTGCTDNAAYFWDVATGQPVGPQLMHHTVVFAVAFSPDGKTVVTGDVDQNVQLWDVATRKRVRQLTGHQGGVNSAAFSSDGSYVITGSTDHTARLWDAASGKAIGPPLRHQGPVVRVAFAGGKTIWTATQDQTTFSWQLPTPMDGTPKHLALWAQVVTGMELQADGAVHILDAAIWQNHRQALEASR